MNAATAVRSAAGSNGMPKSRLSPTAAPMNSATSVAMATSSATTQRLSTTGRGYRERHASARFMPDAMPSLALSDWMSIDMRMATTTTHVSRNP